MRQNNRKLYGLAQGAMIAAIYVVLTMVFAPISFGPVQFRISEALCILPFFTPAAVPGLFIGCLLILSSFLIAPHPLQKNCAGINSRRPFSFIFVLLAAARWPENATCYARFTKKPVRPAHAAHAPDCGRAH